MAEQLNKKVIVLILCCVFVICGMITGYFILRNVMYEEGDVGGVTREQYDLLQAAIAPDEPEVLESMSDVERRNAWIFLNGMEEAGFNENTPPGYSGVLCVAVILDMLGIGEIVDFKIVELEECESGFNIMGWFVAQITDQDGQVYYVWYYQGNNSFIVREGSKNGKTIYSIHTHAIIDDRIYEREYLRGPVIRDEE